MTLTDQTPGSPDVLTRLNRQQEALLTIGRVLHDYEQGPGPAAREITEILSRILCVGQVSLWRHDKQGSALICDDLYEATSGIHSHGMVLDAGQYAAYLAVAADRGANVAGRAGSEAVVGELTPAYLEKQGEGEVLNVPFYANNELAGMLCFAQAESEGGFHIDEINTAKYLASLLGAKIETRLQMEKTQEIEALLGDELALWTILFEQSMDGIVVLEMDGSVYRANKRYADMLGYTQEEMTRLYVWDWEVQYSREEVLELLRVVDTSGAHFETTQKRKDGTIIRVELSNNGAHYKGKKLIFCIVRDITERKEAEEKIHLLATTDSLTGLTNRQEFSRVLEEEITRADRYDNPLCLIMFDLDHFKGINDRFGHDVGDYVLSTIAALVNDSIRSSDILARWGGEEFMVLLPHTDLPAAQCVAEKLRKVIAQHRFDRVESVTASFGLARFSPQEDAASLQKRADTALYRAKANGRNCVESDGEN